MRKGILPVSVLLMMLIIALAPISIHSASAQVQSPSSHIHAFWRTSPSGAAPKAVPAAAGNLSYHGGAVMGGTSNVYAIFWQPNNNVSANYQSLIQRYFNDVGGSPLYAVNTQYNDASGNRPTGSRLAGVWTDNRGYPGNPLINADIQGEISHAQSVNGWSAGGNNIFFVFTQRGQDLCFDGSHAQCASNAFCAYHSAFGNGVIYGAMPYAASFHCGANRPNGDDADLTINVTSHEQMEAATDPYPNSGWADSSGQENGDKCAWNFGNVNGDGSNVNWNGHPYALQQEWSNAISGCTLGNGGGTSGQIGTSGGKCVDVSGANSASGTRVQMWDCNGTSAQAWTVASDHTLHALGKCLDIIGNGTAIGTKVEIWDCNGVGGQQWVPQSNGSLRNPQSNRCLDDPGSNTANGIQLQIWDCNGTGAQVFRLP